MQRKCQRIISVSPGLKGSEIINLFKSTVGLLKDYYPENTALVSVASQVSFSSGNSEVSTGEKEP